MKITTLPAITISFDIALDNICKDEIPAIDATVTPGGYFYDYKWYDSSGNLIGTGATWTPTAEGNYSLVVSENQSGVSCNSSTYSFTITFDYIGPGTLNVPPPLQIECNQSDAETVIATWLATATAADGNISSIPVTSDYSIFTHSCGATRTVTFTATDNCGNTTTGTSQIRIIDTTPPVITSPAAGQTVECDGTGNTTALNTWLANSAGSVATDACGGTLTWTNNYTALSDLCGATGVATVTFTVTDACGNTATTVATFTIIDTQAPTISCPPTATGNTDANECYSTTVVLGTATGTDNCSAVTVTNDAPAQFPAGTTTVTWTATDACGNTATCTQMVIVSDATQPPVIACPASVEEIIAADQCSKTGVTPGLPTISDNCPNPAVTYTLTGATTGSGIGTVSNTTFNVGVTTVTYTVTDLGGNTVSCSFAVWIKRLDIPAAVITCPANPAPVDAVSGTCSATVTLAAPVINDPCNSIVSVVHDSPYGTSAADASGSYPSGTTTVTWTITDTSGNVETCTQVVIVKDTQSPVFVSCPTNQEQNIINGGCDLANVIVPNPTFSDNCGIESLTWIMTGATTNTSSSTGINYVSGQTFNVGVTVITYTVTDVSGLTATCTFTVWMKNLNAPQFAVNCRTGAEQTISVPADAGVCQANVTVLSPVISNPCNEVYTITNSFNGTNNASGIYQIGTTTVTWTIIDASGNVFTCVQTVTVNDTQSPVFTVCPPNVEDLITNGGCDKVSGNIIAPVISDNCPNPVLSYNLVYPNGTPASGNGSVSGLAFPTGITTVTYTATDAGGLTATCTFTVWIKNLAAPQFAVTCRTGAEQIISVPAEAGVCQANVTVLSPVISNPCNEVYTITNSFNGTNNASGIYQVGTTTVTWTIIDASGNITTCTQYVTVTDTQNPVFTLCPANQEQNIINGGCDLANVIVPNPTFSDNCAIESLTWIMTGATTNTSSTTGINYVSGQTFNVGVTLVSYTVTDVNGLTATCTFTVWMKNLNAPQFAVTCRTGAEQTISVPAEAGVCQANVTVLSPVISNPCNEVYTITNSFNGTNNASGTYQVGTTTVTWTIIDASGNITTCTQYVTVTDTQNPVFTLCPANQEQNIINGGCDLANVIVPNPTFSDNCAIESLTWIMTGATTNTSSTTGINYVSGQTFNVGVTLVSYTVTDVNGLTATCTFTVWMKNLNAPKLTAACPGDVSVPADQYVCEAVVTVPAPGITNPCNELYTVFNNSPYKTSDTDASGTYPVGTTTVTWTVTDASGNVTTCTQYVIVTDLMPTINCPADITAQADFELPYKDQVTVPHPTYDDNCPDPVLTWVMSGVTTGASTNTTGESFVPSPSRFNVGVTSITYTVTDSNGNAVSCAFTVTITGKPIIDCPATITSTTDPGVCTKALDPGVPVLSPGSPPATSWSWVMTGATTGSGGNNGSAPLPVDPNPFVFNTGVTTITWTACNISGCSSCTQEVIVEDKEPPTFTPVTITECVDLLTSAVYTATSPDPNSGIEPNLIVKPSPDYYTFKAGNIILDLTILNDNCCTASMTVNWRIKFTDVPDPLNPSGPVLTHPDITGIGQPSGYIDPVSGLPADIYMWGDGVNYTPVTHSIFYWVEDCNGNTSGEREGKINVTPRPQIIKMN